MQRTLSVGHVEQVGLRRHRARLTLLSLRQLDTQTQHDVSAACDADKHYSC